MVPFIYQLLSLFLKARDVESGVPSKNVSNPGNKNDYEGAF